MKQRIHDLYDFYIESKKVKRKIKKAHKHEIALNQSQLLKEPPKNEHQENLTKPSLKDASIPKGYYLQVGAFLNAPSKDFLQTLKNFPYQIEKKDSLMHYFIGPLQNQTRSPKTA